ncbi:MAG: hypothetical protein WA637_11750, partial [Terriglobales bacterium]
LRRGLVRLFPAGDGGAGRRFHLGAVVEMGAALESRPAGLEIPARGLESLLRILGLALPAKSYPRHRRRRAEEGPVQARS